jgi:predicted phosphatase
MDSSVQIKAIRLMSVFEDYDLAIYHAYEFMEFYFLVEPCPEKRRYWMDIIEYLTKEKNEEKNQIAEVVQVTDRKFLWLNVWKQNIINEYFVTTHAREDLADKVIDEELKDIHVLKVKIEL